MTPPPPSDIFKPGQVLNSTYEVVAIPGRGGTGEVCPARNRVPGRQNAIKALNPRFRGSADHPEPIERAEEMHDIVHDGVVRYSD